MKKKIWLDLELVGDIDDAIVLLYSLEKNLNIGAVSLLNPISIELSFVRYWLDKYDRNILLFTHFDEKIKRKNQTHELISKYKNETYPILSLSDIPKGIEYTVMGGGSYTIPNMLRKDYGLNDFVLQGGYAGSNVCKVAILDKFKGLESCPSWNPNIDKPSSKEMIESGTNITFISKDICHDSDINKEFVEKMKDGYTKDFLLEYFGESKIDKKMHDLVALLYIIDNSFCETLPVDMTLHKHKWSSKENKDSNQRISIDWDKSKFLKMILN